MIRTIWDKLVNREVISYLIFGVLTTLVNWLVYAAVAEGGTDYRISTAAAWLVSVLFAFVVNKLFVFQSHSNRPGDVFRELSSFAACRGASGIMELLLMVVMVSGLRLSEYFSKLVVSVLVIIVNYMFSKLFIFKKKPCEER